MPKLVVNPGTPQAREFELKPGSNYVGRGFANDLKIEDVSVSTSHAQIVVSGASVTVKDLGSTNGTFINRSQIKEAVLQPGQLLRLGGVELAYQTDPVAAAPVAVADPSPPTEGEIDTNFIRANTPPVAAVATQSPPAVRVAVARAVAPVPVAEPPLPPPIHSAAAAGTNKNGKSVCRFHPRSPAAWMCPKCHALYCDLCVGTRPTSSGAMGHFCRPCGENCSRVAMESIRNSLDEGTFFTHLPKAFSYPFKGGGGFTLFCATVFFAILSLLRSFPALGGLFVMIGQWMIMVMYYGYLYSYLQNIIHSTAQGDEYEPALPDISDFGQDLFVPFMQLVSTVVLCFGLAIGFAFWAGYQVATENPPTALWGVAPAILLGCVYLPMAFLTVAMFDTVAAINPMVVVPAIFKMPVQYLVACGVLCVAAAVYWLGDTVLPMMAIASGVNRFLAPLLVSPFTGFIWLYLLTVMARILGLLYYKNKAELGWFNR